MKKVENHWSSNYHLQTVWTVHFILHVTICCHLWQPVRYWATTWKLSLFVFI